jgi:hypothetical protein
MLRPKRGLKSARPPDQKGEAAWPPCKAWTSFNRPCGCWDYRLILARSSNCASMQHLLSAEEKRVWSNQTFSTRPSVPRRWPRGPQILTILLHQARPGEYLSSAAGAGFGPVEDELPVVTGPVRVECGTIWFTGSILVTDEYHESGRRLRSDWTIRETKVPTVRGPGLRWAPDSARRGVRGVGPAEPVCARVYGRLSRALADAIIAPTRRRGPRGGYEIFRRRQLYTNSSKCEFRRTELGFLGNRPSHTGVSVDPRKVQSIMEWAMPTSSSEVRRFKPTARFAWTRDTQASFDALKQALCSAPVLSTFDLVSREVLTTDANKIAVAATAIFSLDSSS